MTSFTHHMAAFSNAENGGNPAGVVVGPKHPSPTEMMQTAADFGYPESAFLAPHEGDASQKIWDIRFFAPEAEVPFCGHATIATGVALGQEFGEGVYQLYTQAGLVAVEVSQADGGAWLATLTSPPTKVLDMNDGTIDQLLTIFGWGRDDLNPAFPVKLAHAGANHPVVVLKDRAKFQAMDYPYDTLREFMLAEGYTTISVIWVEDGVTYHARNPFPVGGIVEDPATGAAAAGFGAYLRDLGGRELGFTIHQGVDMGRPSLIRVEASHKNGGPSRVTGTAERLLEAVKL